VRLAFTGLSDLLGPELDALLPRLSRQVGDQAYLVGHQALLGSLSLALGDPPDAAARLVPLCDQLPGVGYRPATQFLLPEAAEAAIGAGQPGMARSLLTKLYAKLGVRSRTQLAGRLRGDPARL
jgi:hypothetical protein